MQSFIVSERDWVKLGIWVKLFFTLKRGFHFFSGFKFITLIITAPLYETKLKL